MYDCADSIAHAHELNTYLASGVIGAQYGVTLYTQLEEPRSDFSTLSSISRCSSPLFYHFLRSSFFAIHSRFILSSFHSFMRCTRAELNMVKSTRNEKVAPLRRASKLITKRNVYSMCEYIRIKKMKGEENAGNTCIFVSNRVKSYIPLCMRNSVV